jgi:hypothetical protein
MTIITDSICVLKNDKEDVLLIEIDTDLKTMTLKIGNDDIIIHYPDFIERILKMIFSE